MKTVFMIIIQLLLLNRFVQGQTEKKLTYYCAPCGCEYDGKIFDSAAKCPKCSMRLLEVGTYNYESPAVSREDILVYSSNRLDNKRQLFSKPLHSAGPGTLIGEGGLSQFSPDGRKIVFEYKDSIVTYDLKKKKSVNLSKNIGTKLINPQTPCWTADGKGILFAAGKFPILGIYELDLAHNKIETIIAADGLRYAPAASPDGRKIAYRCRVEKTKDDVRRGIAIYDLGTKQETFISTIGEYCTWSPDGRQLAFHWPDSSDFCIYIVNADGSGLKKIVSVKGSDNELPCWSHDGKKIYFQTNRRKGNWEIWWMNADGTDQEPLLWQD